MLTFAAGTLFGIALSLAVDFWICRSDKKAAAQFQRDRRIIDTALPVYGECEDGPEIDLSDIKPGKGVLLPKGWRATQIDADDPDKTADFAADMTLGPVSGQPAYWCECGRVCESPNYCPACSEAPTIITAPKQPLGSH